MINVNLKNAVSFLCPQAYSECISEGLKWLDILKKGTGAGSDFIGWVNLPDEITSNVIDSYKAVADDFKALDYVVVIGIGGSYLGAKAAYDILSDNFSSYRKGCRPQLLFAGNNLSEEYMCDMLCLLENRTFGIVVISKSGTTTEPAVAFRILKKTLEDSVGAGNAKELIVAVTDKAKGALRSIADRNGYRTFVIPDNVGGRYSVLTPVGLLPLAIAGFDIEAMVAGARKAAQYCLKEDESNPAVQYAAARNTLYRDGRQLELLTSYRPKLRNLTEWWKQLYGESEGKEGKGIFPASVVFTMDLHSLGQYIQEGLRILFETNLVIKDTRNRIMLEAWEDNSDGLNYLAGKSLEQVNETAQRGVKIAHVSGGVPNIDIEMGVMNEESLGELFYFFEAACGISAYMLGVNPFNQPGVEAYKTNMFKLLGKPGYTN